jgi:hypothetical protein
MKRPKEITEYDMPTTVSVPDGYYITQVPDASNENIQFLMDKHNELLSLVVTIAERNGVKFEEEEQ